MTFTRERIVAEIQRVASELGKAPGFRRFAEETGIQQHDWLGVFWARWSDAVAEAGLNGNTMQGRRSDDDIAVTMIRAIRDLGRYPAVGDMKLRRRSDPSFPDYTIFRTRGGRVGGAKIVLDYCLRAPAEYADVIALVEPIATSSPTPEALPGEPATIDTIAGYVYLIKSGRHYKVGLSTDVQRRMSQLNTGMPESGELIHTISTDDPTGIERYWHMRFAARRLRPDAEWFNLTADDLRAFKRRKFQ